MNNCAKEVLFKAFTDAFSQETAKDAQEKLQQITRETLGVNPSNTDTMNFCEDLLEYVSYAEEEILFENPALSFIKNWTGIDEIAIDLVEKALTPKESGSSGEESKIDNLDPNSESKIIQDFRSNFITSVYGGQSAARAAMEVKFKQILNNFIMFNPHTGQEINTQGDLDRSVFATLKNLYEEFRTFATKTKFKDADKLPISLMEGNVKTNWGIVQQIVGNWSLDTLRLTGINKLYNEARMGKEVPTNILGVFQTYFILNNFDQLITAMFPKLINIAEDAYGQMVGPTIGKRSKYQLDLTNDNVSASWSTDEELSDAIAESSASLKIFWESQLLYDRDTDIALTTMSSQEVAILWNKLRAYKYRCISPLNNRHINHLYDSGYLTDDDIHILARENSETYKSFSDLIYEADTNPKALRLIFKLAAFKPNPEDTYPIDINSFDGIYLTREQKNLAYSIYKQVFSENKTLYSAYLKNRENVNFDYNSTVKDFYNHIIHFFTTTKQIPMSQSQVTDSGNYVVKTLGETALDNAAYGFMGLLDGNLSASNEVAGEDATTIETFKKTYVKQFDNFTLDRKGISDEVIPDKKESAKYIDITLKPAGRIIRISNNLTATLGTISDGKFTPIKKLKDLGRNFLTENKDICATVFEILGLQRYTDDVETTLTVIRQQGVTDLDLFGLAANALYNYSISCQLLGENLTTAQYEAQARKYYLGDTHKPRLQKDGTNLKSINDDKTGTLRRFVRALDIVNGVIRDAIVKGADGKMINTITLNQLLATASDQWHREMSNPNNACKGFTSLYNAYVGEELSRDVVTHTGNEKTSEFTPAENFAFNFVADYLAGMYPEKDGETIMRVFPLVISDKTRLPKLRIDLNAINPKTNKAWKDHSYAEIQEATKEELGEYYLNCYLAIQRHFNVLSTRASINTFDENGEIHLTTGTFGNSLVDSDVRYILGRLNGTIGALDPDLGFNGFNSAIEEFRKKESLKLQNGDYFRQDTEEYQITKKLAVDQAKLTGNDAYTILNDLVTNQNSVYRENFEKYVADSINDRAETLIQNVLHELILRSQEVGTPVSIIANSYYILNKGKLWVNYGLVDQLYRWGKFSREKAESLLPEGLLETGHGDANTFFEDKAEQFLCDVLQDGGYINLKNRNAAIKEGALNKVQNAILLPETSNSEAVSAYSGGKLVLGVISYVGIDSEGRNTIFHEKLTDKSTFKKSYILKQTFNYLKYNEDPNLAKIVENFDTAEDWFEDPSFKFKTFLTYLNATLLYNERIKRDSKALIQERDRRIARITQQSKEYEAFLNETKGAAIQNLKQEQAFLNPESRQYKILSQRITNLQNKLAEGLNETRTRLKERKATIKQDFDAKLEKVKLYEQTKPITDFKVELTINPEIRKFNMLSFLFGQEYTIATVGTHLNHPGKDKTNLQAFEAGCWAQQVKRNVTMTATKHAFKVNQLNGLPAEVKQCIISNLKDEVYNLCGTQDLVFNDDGACYTLGVTNYWENASLNADAVGTDKKTFFHMHNAETGTGYIGKDAGFAATNARIRNSKFYKYLNYRGLADGDLSAHFINGGLDITTNYKGGKIIFKDFAYKRILDSDSRLNLEITQLSGKPVILNNKNIKVLGESIKFNNSTGLTEFKAQVFEEDGSVNTVDLATRLTNAYSIWQFFGGAYSALINNSGTLYTIDKETKKPENNTYNDESNRMLAYLGNELGTIITENLPQNQGKPDLMMIQSQLEVDQWLKKSVIMYFPTIESVKQGSANVNDASLIDNLDYKFTSMVLQLYDAGVQLNAEHHADDTVISMMTQVLNALGARGYTAIEANKAFKALRALTAINLKGYIDSLKINDDNARHKFEDFLTTVITKTINGGSSLDEGTLAGALLYQAKKLIESGQGLKYKDIKELIPMDDITLLKAEMSKIASALVKTCIKLKFPGSMDVLSPSNGKILLYNGKMESEYNGDFSSLRELDETLAVGKHRNISEVELGKTYRIYNTINAIGEDEFIAGTPTKDGYSLFKVNTPPDYWLLKTFLAKHPETAISESVSSGRDLASYNIKFKDADGNVYNMWDIKEIKDLYNPDLTDAKSRQELTNALQRTLNALSNDPNFNEITVIDVNNEERTITIDKHSVETVPYELIMSMHDKRQFGLKAGDSVQDISQNRLFFLERQFKEFNENSIGPKDDLYDIELQAINSEDNLYLAFNDKPVDSNHWTQVEFTPYKDENDKLWLLNSFNRKVQQIYSIEDKLYKGANGEMLIVSESPETYVNNTIHSNVTISKRITKRSSEALLDIFENHLLKCEDKGIQTFLRQFKARITSKKPIDAEDSGENANVEQGELAKYIQHYSNEEFTNLLSDFIQFGRDKYLASMEAVQVILSDEKLTTDQKLARLTGMDEKGKPIVKNHKVRAMVDNALETHTSFLKSLEVLAARIPAQCMQSFMAMKVAGFDTSGVNTAYVSRFQIYLQGSDFDIDKVSLLGFKFRNGKFITWSPYMDLNSKALLEASIELPFPTGTYSGEVEDSAKHCTLVDEAIYGITDSVIDHVNIVKDAKGNELFRLIAEKEPSTLEGLPTKGDIFTRYTLYQLSVDKEQSWQSKVKRLRELNPEDLSDTPKEGQEQYPKTKATLETYLAKYSDSAFIAYCDAISGKHHKSSVTNAMKEALGYLSALEEEEKAKQATTFAIQPGEAWETNPEKILRVLESKIKLGQTIHFEDPNVGKLLQQRGFSVKNSIATKDNSNISAAQDFLQFIKNNPDLFIKTEGKWVINLMGKSEADKIILLKKLARFISEVNNFGGLPAFSEPKTLAQKTYNNSIEGLLKVINKHNLSLSKNKHILQDALLNFVSASMYNVSKNPANQIQAQSSVDASDGSVNTIKKVAKPLAYSKKLATYDPGSVTSLYRMMSLTLGGRTNTGIVAASLKNFETLVQYTYNTLNSGTPEETLALLTNRSIANTEVQLLANAHQQDKQNFLPIEVIEALQDVNQVVDAYLNYSGFLSLSTDNAKDPTLPKINAGSKMLGLYLAGLSVGCDIKTLVAILTSKAGLRINDLMNKNIFNGEEGLFDVDAVINYLNNPRNLLKGINKSARDQLVKLYLEANPDKANSNKDVKDYTLVQFVVNPSNTANIIASLKRERATLNQYRTNAKLRTDEESLDNAADRADKTEDQSLFSQDNPAKADRALKRLIDKIEDFVNLKNSITKCYIELNGEKVNAFKQIVELNKMHSEMRCFSPIGRLNQDLPNSINEQIVWKRKFEKGIQTRLDHLSPIETNSARVTKAKERLKKLNESVLEVKDSGLDYTVDFINFVENENYRNEIISIYNDLKYVVNIYGAMASLPNYFGYMQALAAQYRLNSATSSIYKAVDYLTRYFIPIKGSEIEKEHKVNKLIDWLNDDITSSFMLDYFKAPITVTPKFGETLPVYIKPNQDGYVEKSTSNKPITIMLGTVEGNNTFKSIMEEKVLPGLQAGPHKDNVLIKALVFIKNTQTSDGNPIKKIALLTSGIPNTEYENNQLSKYKYGLEQLADMRIDYLGMTLPDALFAYNLIVNKGKSTQSSLTNLFEGWIQSQGKSTEEFTYGSAFIKAYYDSKKIKAEQLLETYAEPSQVVITKILKALAPYDGQFSSGDPYIYVKNPVTRQRELLEKVVSSRNEDIDETLADNLGFSEIADDSSSIEEDLIGEGNSRSATDKALDYYNTRISSNGYRRVTGARNLKIIETFLATPEERKVAQKEFITIDSATSEMKIIDPRSKKVITFKDVSKTMSDNAKKSLKATNMKELLIEAGMIKESGELTQTPSTIMDYLESLKNESSTCKA